jgi:hypothetical protein
MAPFQVASIPIPMKKIPRKNKMLGFFAILIWLHKPISNLMRELL